VSKTPYVASGARPGCSATSAEPTLALMAGRRGGARWGRWLLVAFALAIINVPYVLHEWQLHRAATDGVRVTATVRHVVASGSDSRIDFVLPRDVDAGQKLRTATVDRGTAAEAARTRQVGVRVLRGHPDAFDVDGQIRSRAGLVLALVADAVVVLMLVLSWRLGGRIRRPTLVGVAVEDVRSGEEGSLLDKQDDGTYLINGEVTRTGPSSLLLSLRDRDVEIQLRDHENPIAVGDRAAVRAQLVG
jgi:hypothetical protein